jgi:ribonuclease BN (tRNA processing enzyme)
MRLTVLGSSGTYPAAGRACSGYLLEADEGGRTTRVWVDTGPGTLSNLLRVAELPTLDAIWVSHLHVDHVGDLLAANYALRYGDFQPPPAPVPVFGPTDWVSHVRPFLSTGESEPIDGTFEVHDLHDGERVDLGPLRLEAVATVHSVETYGVRASAGGRTLAYSADSGPATPSGAWPTRPTCSSARPPGRVARGRPPDPPDPAAAGEWAAKARARRLLLTHLRPARPEAAAARAAEAYGGPVGVATELEVTSSDDRKTGAPRPAAPGHDHPRLAGDGLRLGPGRAGPDQGGVRGQLRGPGAAVPARQRQGLGDLRVRHAAGGDRRAVGPRGGQGPPRAAAPTRSSA